MLQKIKKVKPLYALIAVALVIAAIGVLYYVIGVANAPKVVTGDTVQVYYTGTLTNGTVFDSNVGKQPLQFTIGANQVIPGFEQGIIGMKLNQNSTLTIPANEAYGQVNPSLFIQVPLTDLGNFTVKQGSPITETSPTGQQYQGIVTSLNSTTATVDFNSPLAGQTLVFSVKVVGITK
jgi:peptidylprolyl isomerase